MTCTCTCTCNDTCTCTCNDTSTCTCNDTCTCTCNDTCTCTRVHVITHRKIITNFSNKFLAIIYRTKTLVTNRYCRTWPNCNTPINDL